MSVWAGCHRIDVKGHGRRIKTGAGCTLHFEFEGRDLEAMPGETLAAALIANGHYNLRTAEDGSGRGVLCGIGVCWECRCVVDGRPNTRACMVEVVQGMSVRRQRGLDG